MADPGLPEAVARSIAADLSRDLTADADADPRWEVEVSQQTLPLTREGSIPLLEHAQALRENHGWDYVVYLTDLPRSHERDPMVCEASATAEAALISLPALDAVCSEPRTRKLLSALIGSMRDGTEDCPFASAALQVPGRAVTRRASGTGDAVYIVLAGRWSRWRLLAAMVRSNRPGRLLPALSSGVAAAAATADPRWRSSYHFPPGSVGPWPLWDARTRMGQWSSPPWPGLRTGRCAAPVRRGAAGRR